MLNMAPDEFSTGWKFDLTIYSHETVQYFRSVHTELWTAKRLNFRTVEVVPCERNT